MSQEILDRLRRLHQHAAAVRGLVETVTSSAPRAADGRDPTGSVHVTVDHDGLPTLIRVEAGWQRSIGPAALGGCVLAAFTDAVAAGMAAWSETLDRISWRPRVEQMEAERRRQAEPRLTSDITVSGPARDIPSLAEDVLTALNNVRARAGVAPVMCVGSSAGGNVTIALARTGLQACSLEPGWTSRQSTPTLNYALADALRAARERLAEQAARRHDDLDELVNESLATLSHLRSLADEQKGRPHGTS